MTRHISDMARARRSGQRLLRFLRLERRQNAALVPVFARNPRHRNAARKLVAFARIARQA